MKKIAAFVLALTSALGSLYASYNYDMSGGYFYDSDGHVLDKAYMAIVVCENDLDLSLITLEDGYTFIDDSWLNDNSSDGVYILNVSSFDDSFPFAQGVINNDNLPSEFTGDERIAIIAWAQSDGDISSTIDVGTDYLIFSPELIGGDLSGGMSWNLDPSNSKAQNWAFLSTDMGGSISWENLALSKTVIPEPAEYAAAFGVLALVLAYIRKRK